MESNRARLRVIPNPSKEYIEDALRRAKLVQAGKGFMAADTKAMLRIAKQKKKWKENG